MPVEEKTGKIYHQLAAYNLPPPASVSAVHGLYMEVLQKEGSAIVKETIHCINPPLL